MNHSVIDSKDVLVRAQDTPNPYAIKFIVNHVLKDSGKATFYSSSDCKNLPLLENILNINGVKQIYVFENTVTVTFDDSISSEDLKNYVKAIIQTRLPIHNPDFKTDEENEAPVGTPMSSRKVHEDPLLNEIEEILDRTIRMGLQSDGGDVEIISFKDNELRILYQGACGGCPSSTMGTLDAIQNILRNELNREDLFVVPI